MAIPIYKKNVRKKDKPYRGFEPWNNYPGGYNAWINRDKIEKTYESREQTKKEIVINPFTDVPRIPLQGNENWGANIVNNLTSMSLGGGSRTFRADPTGIWLGAEKFTDAPFSVDTAGAAIMKSATFKSSTGTTFIDGGGVISTINFANVIGSYSGSQNIANGAGEVDLTNLSITYNDFASARNKLLLVFLSIQIFVTGAVGGVLVNLYRKIGAGSWVIIGQKFFDAYTAGAGGVISDFLFFTTTSQDAHYFKATGQTSGAGATGQFVGGKLNCLSLGS